MTERGDELAMEVAPPEDASFEDASIEVLTFELQGETFALDAGCVCEILDLVHITEVPESAPFVNGLINVRGKVVPLADLRLKFEMEVTPPTIDTRIVVVEIPVDGEPTTVGLRADKVYEVTNLLRADLTETPTIGMRWRPEYIRCIGKRDGDFIVVLDIERIFANGAHAPLAAGHQSSPDANAVTQSPAAVS